jgi:hypothetical protein
MPVARGNPQNRQSTWISTRSVVANTPDAFDLPRSFDFEALFLRITGSLVVSVGATSVRAEAPLQTLARIEVIADGKNTLINLPGHMAGMGNVFRPQQQANARVTTPPTAATAATYAVEGNIALDFASPRSVRPKDTNLRTSGFTMFQCRLTYGAAGDNFVGGTVAYSAMTVEVYAQQLQEFKGSDGQYSMPVALKKISYQEVSLAAASTNRQIMLPTGNLIPWMLLRTEGVTAGEPSAAILNNVTSKASEDVRFNLSGANLRAKNNADYGYVQAGYYVIDPQALGDARQCMTCAWDVTGQPQPQLVVDTTGGANQKIMVATCELILQA